MPVPFFGPRIVARVSGVLGSADPAKTCGKCQQYNAPEGGAACGGCKLFKGPVSTEGNCAGFVLKA